MSTNTPDQDRPASAPKCGEIPSIVLIQRADGPADKTSSSDGQRVAVDIRVTDDTGSCGVEHRRASGDHSAGGGGCKHGGGRDGLTIGPAPHRSSSDIGLPTASMPNLALQLGLSVEGGGTGSDSHLGVFCSPRTSRRSVDLDYKDDRSSGNYEWLENFDSSSNSLRVLTASSRVGSALSLNSECTARSIGLLSNDSDSDNDVSLSERERLSDKPAQLRRYMSHPEEGASPEVSARPSQSLCNLKSSASEDKESDSRVDIPENPSSTHPGPVSSAAKPPASTTENNPTRKNVKISTSTPLAEADVVDELHKRSAPTPQSKKSGIPLSTGSESERAQVPALRRHKRLGADRPEAAMFTLSDDKKGSTPGGAGRPSSHVVCYKCDTNDTSRDGRIRQWLQDMDNHPSLSTG